MSSSELKGDESVTTQVPASYASDSHLNGLGGWLVLVALGLFLSPVGLLYQLYTSFILPILNGDLAAIADPASAAYNTWLLKLIAAEILANLALAGSAVFLLVLFFRKNRNFPAFYSIWLLCVPGVFLLDAVFSKLLMPELEVFDRETTKELTRGLISCAIWIPYMRLSRRVKATFTNGHPS